MLNTIKWKQKKKNRKKKIKKLFLIKRQEEDFQHIKSQIKCCKTHTLSLSLSYTHKKSTHA